MPNSHTNVSRNGLLQWTLSGDTSGPVPCAPLYLDLYFAGPSRRERAQVYRELADGTESLTLTLEVEAVARAEAWSRFYAPLQSHPAWVPCLLGPARTGVDGTRLLSGPGSAWSTLPALPSRATTCWLRTTAWAAPCGSGRRQWTRWRQ